MKMAHLGDTHISVNHKRWLTLDRALRDMVSQIADAHPDLIVHAGDLGELHPSAQDLYCQAVFLQRLAGIAPTVLVAGNHDSNPHLQVLARIDTEHPLWISTSPDTLALMRGDILHLSDIDSSEMENIECVIHTLPWTAKARVRSWYLQTTGHAAPEEEADRIAQEFLSQMFVGMRAERQAVSYAGPSILLGHLDVSGAKLDSGQPNAAAGMSVSVHDLASATTSACLLGHIHARQELGDDGEGIFYSGSPCRLSWGEAGADEKGWGLLTIPRKPGMRYERMNIASPRLWAVEAEWAQETETHPTDPDACIGVWQFVGVPDKPSLSDLLSEVIGPDDELRFRYHVPEDQREAVKAIRAREVEGYWRGKPESITYDPIVEPTDHARAPEIASQSDPVDMLETWAAQDGRADRVTPAVKEKVREIAGGFSHGTDNGSALLEHTRLRVHGIGRLRDVDLEIPEGVTAITGPNGHGKSTILRSVLWGMHRRAPKGASTDPLGKWAVTKDAHLILDSENGVPITASHTLNGERKSVAQSAVLTVDGRIINESGLVKEFDAEAEQVYPNYDLYLASAFAEQEGAGAFHAASVADRKAVLRKALHLDELEGLSESAKGLRKSSEQDIASIQSRIEDLAGADLAALGESLEKVIMEREAWDAQIDEMRPRIEVGRTAVATAEAAHRDVEKAVEDYLEKKRRIARLTQQRVDAEGAVKKAEEASRLLPDLKLELITGQQVQKEIDELRPQIQVKKAEVEAKRERWEDNHKALVETKRAIEQDRGILARAEEIRAAAVEVKAIQGTLPEAEEGLEKAEREVERNRERVEAHGKAMTTQERLGEKMARYERAAENLAGVPCGGEGEFSACRFLVDAVQARETIPEITDQIAVAALDLDPDASADLDSSMGRLRVVKDEITVCRSRLDAARASAADLPLLEDAEHRVQKLQERVDAFSELEGTLEMTGKALASETKRMDEERVRLEGQISAHHPGGLSQTQEHVAKVEAEAATLQERQEFAITVIDELEREQESLGEEPSEQDAREALGRARMELADLEESESKLRKAIEGVSIRIATVEEQIRVAEESAKKRADLEAEVTRLHQEAADWKFIEAGFSKSGVQALLMDAMGPAISERTNAILEEVGSEYRVQLTTTRQDSTGKKVLEDLDLLVTGSGLLPGSTIGNLSPGQRVVVGLAFRLGLCLHYGGGGVSPWLLDEADGGLDSANVRRYVPIIRAAMKVGNVKSAIFVTHRLESVEAADHILHVEEGRARLEARS